MALSYIAQQLGTRAPLAETTDRMNRALPEQVLNRFAVHLRAASTVAILGLAFKPLSHVVEESQSLLLAQSLAQLGKRVVAFDPLANETARAALPPEVTICDTLAECLFQANVVLITTPDPRFKRLTAEDFDLNQTPVTVIDFWRILDGSISRHPKIKYVAVGHSADNAVNAARLAQLWASRGME